MADSVTISEAKTTLSKLIARAEAGEDVVIRRGNTDVVRLVAVEPRPNRRRARGALKGQIWMADDWNELGSEWDEYVK